MRRFELICTARRGFSLVELIVVIVIIGLLAAIAIPRLSRGSQGASISAAARDLSAVRAAIMYYALEHENAFPGPTAEEFADQLTQYSTRAGDTAHTRGGAYIYGPYLHAIPPAPLGANAGSADVLIDSTSSPPIARSLEPCGWVYNPTTGEFLLNDASADLGVLLGGAEVQQLDGGGAIPLPGG